MNLFDRLKSIKTEVKARLAAVEMQQAKKAAVREEKKLRPRKLKYKYPLMILFLSPLIVLIACIPYANGLGGYND